MIINIIPRPYTSYIPQVLTAPSKGKSSRINYYLSTLAQWLFFISYNILPKSLHGLCSFRVLFRPRTYSTTRVGYVPQGTYCSIVWRTIYYLITLAQRLFFINDNKYYPRSIHELYSSSTYSTV